MRSIIVIAGPTASGKSGIAIDLAKRINGVIINADSRQIYKELSIGTAKPSESEMENIPHYLYGYVSITEEYNIHKYQKDVLELIKTIPDDKQIILVGGTGLYIDSVIFGYDLDAERDNHEQRGELTSKTLEDLQSKIAPDVLQLLNESDRNNPRRLVRIIEREGVISTRNTSPVFPCKYFVVDFPKEILEKNVMQRVEEMFKQGLEMEARDAFEKGYYQYPALQSIGYQEFLPYFEKAPQYTLKEVKGAIVRNTMRYIKRQKTWFRRNPNAIWVTSLEQILSHNL